ncbi:MAG: OFA family MFS transporter [Christensenellaceae bacterium]|jgi:OFA family oxalate/formate antiporter-like MFS transporter
MEKTTNRALPLVAGAVIQLCIGIIYIWSIFKAPFIAYYSNYVSAEFATTCSSLTYSLMLAFFVAGIVLGGRINDKKGPRPVVLAGGMFFFAGIFLSFICATFLPYQPWLICIFYGCLAGFGVGAAYTSTISCAQKWYADKKGFATGVIVCAFGASTVVFTPLVNTLLSSFDVPQTFLILSILFLAIIMVFAWFIKNPSAEYIGQLSPNTAQAARQKQYTPGEVLRTKSFWIIFLCMLMANPAYFILNPMFKGLAEARGLMETAALASVMVTGIASTAGRLIAPWLSDRLGRRQVASLLFIITIAALIFLIFAQGYVYMLLIALIAFGFGGGAGLYPVISAEYFGTRHSATNYGMIMVSFAVSALVFPTVSSLTAENGLPTAATFIIPIVVSVLGLVCTFFLRPPKALQQDK